MDWRHDTTLAESQVTVSTPSYRPPPLQNGAVEMSRRVSQLSFCWFNDTAGTETTSLEHTSTVLVILLNLSANWHSQNSISPPVIVESQWDTVSGKQLISSNASTIKTSPSTRSINVKNECRGRTSVKYCTECLLCTSWLNPDSTRVLHYSVTLPRSAALWSPDRN